jgi:hypothetical protein
LGDGETAVLKYGKNDDKIGELAFGNDDEIITGE